MGIMASFVTFGLSLYCHVLLLRCFDVVVVLVIVVDDDVAVNTRVMM